MPSKTHQSRYNRAKTPKTAAKAFHAWLTEHAAENGYTDASGICHQAKGEGWEPTADCVGWDGGPYEGLVSLSMGESMYAGECGYGNPPEFDFLSNRYVMVEPVNHWLLGFYEA